MALRMFGLGEADLPPLALAVVVLKQALVVGDTVFAENETK